ncbi:MAG: exosporium glycoprotein BclB-related protein, partial [Candidatus Saccharimonadales bacterium]
PLTSLLEFTIITVALTAFGDAVSGIDVTGSVINLQGLSSEAFSFPRDGTITSIAAYLSTTVGLTLGTNTITVQAQVYTSPTPNDVFTAVPGAVVTLSPTLTGTLSIGTVLSGITTDLSIPVTAQTRVMLVYSITSTGGVIQTVVGLASAGLAIQ